MSLSLGVHPYRSLEDDDEVLRFEEELKQRKRKCSCQKLLPIIVLGIMIVVVAGIICSSTTDPETLEPFAPNTDSATTVSCGHVIGQKEDDAFVFKGIPYARPPVGDLRWSAPLPLRSGDGCWHESLDALHFKSKCLQLNPVTKLFEGDEDCLFLNVWTPTLDPQLSLPVLVFVHGGNLHWGSGNEPTFSPTAALAHQYNTVIVSLNYRLFAMGFLALETENKERLSGNYGLQDVVLALQWIRENIAAFGGNPNKVTLFGHSSGGSLGLALLASPRAKGLFHQVWLSSPAPSINTSLRSAIQSGKSFLNKTNCISLDCLRKLSAKTVLDATPENWGAEHKRELPSKGISDQSLIIIDGEFLPYSPMDAWEKGVVNDVPLLIGSTAQELDLMPFTDLTKWNWTQYNAYVSLHLDTFGHEVTVAALSSYNQSSALNDDVPNPELSLTTMGSDVRAVCPTHNLAKVAASHFHSPVYRYVVTARPSSPVQLFFSSFPSHYSFHMLDVVAFFGNLRHYITNVSRSDVALEEEMQTQVMHFVHRGTPLLPSWNTFPQTVAQISNQTTIKSEYHRDLCDFWDKHGLTEYSWTN